MKSAPLHLRVIQSVTVGRWAWCAAHNKYTDCYILLGLTSYGRRTMLRYCSFLQDQNDARHESISSSKAGSTSFTPPCARYSEDPEQSAKEIRYV